MQEGFFVNFCFQQSNILIVNVMDVMNYNQAMFMMIMVRHFVCVSVKRFNTFFFSQKGRKLVFEFDVVPGKYKIGLFSIVYLHAQQIVLNVTK